MTPPDTTAPDVAEIVRGLTKAERHALLRGEPDGSLGLLFVRWWHAKGPTLSALTKRGLGTVVWSGIALSETGLAVRAHLLKDDR